MKYAFIEAHQAEFTVNRMCQGVAVSRSRFYEWRHRSESARQRADWDLGQAIQQAFEASRRTYGTRRLQRQLREAHLPVSRTRLGRLMRARRLYCKTRRRFRATTTSHPSLPVAPNRLNRPFQVTQPDRVYVSDITYIPTAEGWLYLAVLLDLFSRQVVGWNLSARLTAELAVQALRMALGRRRPGPGALVHSDRGSQYASHKFQTLLQRYGLMCSMSRSANCWDNAPAESFFHTLKTELTHHRRYTTRAEAKQDIFEYIEVFYNRQRKHSALNYQTPAEFDQQYRTAA